MTDDEKLEAVPAATPADRYFTEGCGADVLKRDADLCLQHRVDAAGAAEVERLNAAGPAATGDPLVHRLATIRNLIAEHASLAAAHARTVDELSKLEADLLKGVNDSPSATLPSWADLTVSMDVPAVFEASGPLSEDSIVLVPGRAGGYRVQEITPYGVKVQGVAGWFARYEVRKVS